MPPIVDRNTLIHAARDAITAWCGVTDKELTDAIDYFAAMAWESHEVYGHAKPDSLAILLAYVLDEIGNAPRLVQSNVPGLANMWQTRAVMGHRLAGALYEADVKPATDNVFLNGTQYINQQSGVVPEPY